MITTIKTTSPNQFYKIRNYICNKRICFTTYMNNDVFIITLIDLNSKETTSLIKKMTKHFHLLPQSKQGTISLAA